jgi:heat shock protein HslJ
MNRLKGMVTSPVVVAFAAISAVAAGLVALPLALAAQEATPVAGGAIPPIVWELTAFEDSNGVATPVDDPASYTLQFLPEGLVAINADCNAATAEYIISGSDLTFGPIASTLALCPPESQSDQFLQQLALIDTFSYDEEEVSHNLLLGLSDGGTLRFAPSVTGVIWEWERFQSGDGSEIVPDDPARFALEFHPDGSVTGQVDCNRAIGSYTRDGAAITIVLATTRMACGENSLDVDFGRYVGEATSFVIQDGKLSLALPMDSGITTFTARYVDPFAVGTPEAAE